MFNLETDDKKSISFKGSDWDDSYIDIENVAGEYISVLSLMKELYDMIYLKSLFNNSQSTSLSGVMVEKYNQHHNDLENIQNIIKPNKNDSDDIKSLRLEEYHKLFKTKKDSKELCIYDQYLHGIKTQDEFCKEVIKSLDIIFDNCKIDSKYLDVYNNMIKDRLITSNFMPKINSVENGKYPYQLNKEEIIKIIENQGEYYPFLKNKVFDSLTNKEVYKIIRLLEFKIPYYVGPLNDSSSICAHGNKNAWMIKSKNNIQITPYNFNEVVDLDASAEKFIKRMTSKCTYLLDKDAIPANSILYSKFKVMNELKQIKVGGQRLDIFIQKDIIKDLFMKTNKSSITVKDLVNYLNCVPAGNQYVGEITGTSALNKFSNNLKSYVDFFGENGIFNETNYLESDAETIIEWVTIFEDKSMLERKIRTQFEKLNENQIKRIMSLKYSGWSELSKELLTEVYYEDKFHNKQNIMELMENTSDNFMQIINSNKYNFQKKIDKINNINNSKQIKYELVDSLATSPANKRGIYQSLKIVKELVKYMGYDPYSISIEMARGEDQIKGRKDSRKESLINIYNENKSNIENFKSITLELKNCDEKMTLKQYLYFTQECRCMYCGKVFDIANLENTDIDHIIPRTLTKDDSIDNKVLVCSDCNRIKSSSFVVPQEYRVKSKARWEMLHKHKLISQKKLYSLSRSYYSDEDIAGFINRQLVETRQVSKHVASILKNIYSNTNINYLHANLSHNYREKYQMYKYRDLNDYHHAHDAYLAAVLGEYQTKIKYANFDDLKKMNQEKRENGNKEYWKYGYAINMTELPIVNDKTGEVLFDPISFNKTVCDTLYNNDIIVTRKTKYNNGALYKQTLYSPDKANVRIKENMPVELYGGYSNVVPSEITLIKTSKENRMVALPTLFINNNRYKKNKKIDYIKNYLKLNDNVEILKDNIPFDTLLIYEGQKCFIKGFSSSHKNFEISNATELLLSKNIQINYKKALNYLFNNINDTTYDYKNDFCVILNYLFSVKEKYPLFIKEIEKIESSININNLSNDQLKTII